MFFSVVIIAEYHWAFRGHVSPSHTSVSRPVKLLEMFQRKLNIFLLLLRPCARKKQLAGKQIREGEEGGIMRRLTADGPPSQCD